MTENIKKVNYTKHTVTPQVAKIYFIQLRKTDQHLYEEELKAKITVKGNELNQCLLSNNWVNISPFKVETTEEVKPVCTKENCTNLTMFFYNYETAISHCVKEHPNDVHLQLVTLGMIWCLIVDKKYKFLKGKTLDLSGNIPYYEISEPLESGWYAPKEP